MDEKKIISYALGEMSGRERELFEKELASSPDLQATLTEFVGVVSALEAPPRLSEGLPADRRARLLEECKRNIQSRASAPAAASHHWWGDVMKYGIPLAAAACVCVAFLVLQNPPDSSSSAGMATSNPYMPTFSDSSSSTGTSASSSYMPTFSESSAPPAPSYAKSPAVSSRAPSGGSSSGSGSGSSSGGLPSFAMSQAYTDLAMVPEAAPVHNTEGYNAVRENEFKLAKTSPLSTFSIDVDTASYSNVRRFLDNEQLPPVGSVRPEEMVNYFKYDYPAPDGVAPFSVNLEVAPAPWAKERLLVKIGLKGREFPESERPASNLVFLVDTSGSMDSPDKLPLLKKSLKEMVSSLGRKDSVAIVAYASGAGVVLPPTVGTDKETILAALDSLQSGGSTQASAGIEQAYDLALGKSFVPGGSNRVILCTDGDFNVGVTSDAALEELIEQKRKSGVFLTVLGFGTGNLKDSKMELLADKGNGNYAYIDSMSEARKVLGSQLGSTLHTVAKDVKIQVEFNPLTVEGYRLIGYENRMLASEDFNDDKKDAGEIGAGHTVTALYEVVPKGGTVPAASSVDALKYQSSSEPVGSGELLTVKLRYKEPTGDESRLLEKPLPAPAQSFDPSDDFRFAAAVAAFGMKMKGSPHMGDITWDGIRSLAKSALGEDEGSHRAEFLTLVEKAKQLDAKPLERE